MNETFYAHTLPGKGAEDWEPLAKHLEEVRELTARFASAFGAGDWGDNLGRCHDLGKGSSEFQQYLRMPRPMHAEQPSDENTAYGGRVDHSTFGARFVVDKLPGPAGLILAYCIAGHHAGLADASSADDATQGSTLQARLSGPKTIPAVLSPLPSLSRPLVPLQVTRETEVPFALAFFTRMLFSCLVDADRLCTEAFCDPEKTAERTVNRPAIDDIGTALDEYLMKFTTGIGISTVNITRALVLEQCRTATEKAPGFFSLQVPTGGGKTLSSLAFAAGHAKRYGMRRVIVAIPYTSIIEQTADVYRQALGTVAEHSLVEHHTNLQPEQDTRANQYATENWDAPLVVTTNVQLFESMFASATTPCRKLHRLAGSVIILDEAQMLPVTLLLPTLRALRELVLRYGCTVVLCTATQPALEKRPDFLEGLEGVRPIISDPEALFQKLRRAQVVRIEDKQNTDSLAERLAAESKVLAIMNKRQDAKDVFLAVQKRTDATECFHLSTCMCGAHRRDTLDAIRKRVNSGPCRVISTQLVEAGVDLDFPVVYRAEAGFDSIAQAAGRCNREGLLEGLGTTYVFEAEHAPPPGFLRDTAQSAKELWSRYPDPLSPEATEAYFRNHYWQSADILDKKQVMAEMWTDKTRPEASLQFQFRQIAKKYQIVENDDVPILVPYREEAKKYLDKLRSGSVPYISQRQLQAYLVSIPERAFRRLEHDAVVKMHESGVALLLRDEAYSPEYGFDLDELGLDSRTWGV